MQCINRQGIYRSRFLFLSLISGLIQQLEDSFRDSFGDPKSDQVTENARQNHNIKETNFINSLILKREESSTSSQ